MTASEPPIDPPNTASPGGRFNRLRTRRAHRPGTPCCAWNTSMSPPPRNAGAKRWNSSRDRLVIAAGMFALLFTVVCFRVAWVTVPRPVPAQDRA